MRLRCRVTLEKRRDTFTQIHDDDDGELYCSMFTSYTCLFVVTLYFLNSVKHLESIKALTKRAQLNMTLK